MQPFSGDIVSAGSISCYEKSPQLEHFSVTADSCFPSISTPIPTNTLKSASALAILSSILRILVSSAWAKIGAPVIQSIPIGMVNSDTAQQEAVHIDHLGKRAMFAGRVERTPLFNCEPFPLGQDGKVCRIYGGVLSLRQWYQAVRWVNRLGHCVSFHAEFRHVVHLEWTAATNRILVWGWHGIQTAF